MLDSRNAKRSHRLLAMVQSKCNVRRDGHPQEIAIADLVPEFPAVVAEADSADQPADEFARDDDRGRLC